MHKRRTQKMEKTVKSITPLQRKKVFQAKLVIAT